MVDKKKWIIVIVVLLLLVEVDFTGRVALLQLYEVDALAMVAAGTAQGSTTACDGF